ncbi:MULTISPECIES: aldehyde dehydrogenase family protein [unclassified Pseudonocardia]|nr:MULTISPECIES: aldehyde dehydrogenase family protein [unclassified Pseudonocardia]
MSSAIRESTGVDRGGAEVEVRSPADGRVVGSVPDMDAEHVREVAARLRAAQPEWEALGFAGRRKWLGRFRDWLLDNEQRLLEMVREETGKSWGDLALGEITPAVDTLNYYLKHGERFLRPERRSPHSPAMLTKRLNITYSPHQLVGVITPWNAQLSMQMLDAPAALMAGCAVLSKASEETPLAWAEAVRGWNEEIGAPPVLGCVTGRGETGAAVVDEVDMIQFTGSVETGRRIGVRAAERLVPCSLELGGKDAMIVLSDADMDRAVSAAVWGGFYNAGQICVSVERVYVEASVYDEFVDRVAALTRTLRVGSDEPRSYTCDVGAIATERQLEIIQSHVDDTLARGARAVTGGKRAPGSGMFFEPTVLVDVDHSMRCMQEETFGPILPIMKVADEDEAVRMANDSRYGLAASVFSKNRARSRAVAARVDSGTVNINNAMTNVFQLPVPMGGRRDSGIGARLGGAGGIRKYCRTKPIIEERFNLKSELYWYPTVGDRSRLMGKLARFVGAKDLRRRLGR